jgi:ribosome-binding factor A
MFSKEYWSSQEWCIENIKHNDWHVRCEVAKLIDSSYLPQMMFDVDDIIRTVVAMRIDKKNALLMSGIDENEEVRKIALDNALGLV